MNLPALFPSWISAIPLGWIVMGLLFFLLTFDAMRSGPGRSAVLVLASLISVFFYDLAPHTALLGSLVSSAEKSPIMAGAFAVLFVITYLLTYRMTATFSGVSSGLFFSTLAGLSGTIAILVTWQQVPALAQLWNFGSQIQLIFGAGFALPWLLLCFLIFAFIRS